MVHTPQKDLSNRSRSGSCRRFPSAWFVRLMIGSGAKYEEVYLNEYASPRDARHGIERYLRFYNAERLHQSLAYRPPSNSMPLHNPQYPRYPQPDYYRY